MPGERVLVTGGTGFIAARCIVQLLEAGYRVRTTVRDASREPAVRALAAAADVTGAAAGADRLEIVEAHLLSNSGWPEAVADCRYVLHVASPFPLTSPTNENDLVVPARQGALRVLRASRDAGVERVVLTSSFAAVGYGRADPGRPYTEDDWSDLSATSTGEVTPYMKSKTLAERAAWAFMSKEGGALELAVVNPVAVFGPLLGPKLSSSVALVLSLLRGDVPAVPHMFTSAVDVRDVADLHLRAMTHPDARGERFLAVTGSPLSYLQLAHLLRSRLGETASRVPKRQLPDWMVSLMAPFTPQLEEIRPLLGLSKPASNAKAKRMLGWAPRPNIEAILASAESLVELGLVPRRP
ncbi:SDR family oxidoreductase [Subtercola endophyticus]|uniref:SDR family oxidoreductase n=1 Tax=Subtercola endophyticus TaxID=2895559 RepID=UPI001E48028F|nr:aldehyde reductase [Subtercola endophyticus]UFS59414.1 aldehyde reductase [Subtercola endophyticus]